MSSFANKLQDKAIRTIKYPFKTIVVGVFVFLGLICYTGVDANFPDYWNEDYELYNVGDLNGQGGWSGAIYYDVSTNANYIFTGSQGVGVPTWSATTQTITRSIPVEYRVNSADVDGWYFLNIPIKLGEINGVGRWLKPRYVGSASIYFYTAGVLKYGVYGEINKYYCDTGEFIVGGDFSILTDLIPASTWVQLHYQFDLTNNLLYVSWTFNGTRTDYSEDNNICFWSVNPRTDITFSKIEMYGRYAQYFGWDYINNTGICKFGLCDFCDNWFDCGVAGCCWYYNPYLTPTNYCASCEYEECSFETCGSCGNQEDCESVGCYWTGEYCSWIVSECGDGLACQFCETQETCEAKDCFWSTVNQSCWYKAPTLPSSWSTYYDEHGGYEVPAEFVNDLAETTGKAFDTVSSLFEGFAVSFSNSDALARGTALGQTIPKARGYLKIFDGLFGHIPIGETFVFILVFMLAIGLFRTIRHLIQIVKP